MGPKVFAIGAGPASLPSMAIRGPVRSEESGARADRPRCRVHAVVRRYRYNR